MAYISTMQTTGVQFATGCWCSVKKFAWPEKDTANESDRCVVDFKCLRPKQLKTEEPTSQITQLISTPGVSYAVCLYLKDK
jgi:hypothetical protein